jgi:broad specificity phosphatase PhoE
MRRRLSAVLVVATAAVLASCGAVSEPETVRPLAGAALVQALRDGGHVLYLRHTATPPEAVDQPDPLGDCSRQRLLSEAGRADAVALGRAVRELGVPVGEVRASPFCRTVDTARLAFGGQPGVEVRTDDGLVSPAPDGEQRVRTTARLRQLLRTVPDDGTNVVLVGHLTNLRLLSRASPEEGGTVLLRPDGEGFSLVGQVPPQGWQDLARRRS